jgi:hypothetical protein
MNGLGMAGVELHGMMGYMVLAHYRMEIDLTRDKMKWTELAFDPPPLQNIRVKDAKSLASLELVGSLMKLLGALAGKQQDALRPRGFLGIEVAEEGKAVIIRSVLAKTPAAEGGLKAGDRIERLQGKAVRSIADVQGLTARIIPGREVRFHIRRGDQKKDITITAGEGL